jgi:hypothetical protein
MWYDQEQNEAGLGRKGKWDRGKFQKWCSDTVEISKSFSGLEPVSPTGDQDATGFQDDLMRRISSDSLLSTQSTPRFGSSGMLKSSLRRSDTPTKSVSFAEGVTFTPSAKSRRQDKYDTMSASKSTNSSKSLSFFPSRAAISASHLKRER